MEVGATDKEPAGAALAEPSEVTRVVEESEVQVPQQVLSAVARHLLAHGCRVVKRAPPHACTRRRLFRSRTL